jgi:hypothetical protein
LNISPPSSSKLSLNWIAVLAMSFLSAALRSMRGHLPQILAVPIEKVEGHHHDLVGVTLQLVLQDREVRGAIRGGDYYFAVNDRGPRIDQIGVRGNLPETPGPVIAIPCEDLDVIVDHVKLVAVAVELDLMNPSLSARHLTNLGCQGGLDKSGEGSLDAERGRFGALVRH